jgi:integrase
MRPDAERAVHDYGNGVVMYDPKPPSTYFRISFIDENGKKRWTSATSLAQGDEKCRLFAGAAAVGLQPSRQTWSVLVAAYEAKKLPHLDPGHAEDDLYVIRKWLVGAAAPNRVSCRDLKTSSFQPVMDAVEAAGLARSTQQTVRRVISRILTFGRGEGFISRNQEPLAGLRYMARDDGWDDDEDLEDDGVRPIRQDEVPPHDLIACLGERAGVMYGPNEELFVNTAAYAGQRWGEGAVLRGRHVLHPRLTTDPQTLRIARKLKELAKPAKSGPHAGERVYETAPKTWRRRLAWYPAETPCGFPLAERLVARAREVGPDGLMFTAPRGGYLLRSNYRQRRWAPLTDEVSGWSWNFHMLRHTYATYLWNDLGLAEEDCTVFTGHATVKTFHDIYVGVRSTGAALRAAEAADRYRRSTEMR